MARDGGFMKPSKSARSRRTARPSRAVAKPSGARCEEAIALLERSTDNVTLEFPEGAVTITRLDKLLWPSARNLPSYTRREHMRYLLSTAPYMLPHVTERPLTLIRQPEGVGGRRFVQFHWEGRLPPFVGTVNIYSERNDVSEEYLLCNNVPTLLWLAHVGCLELHPWHSRASTGRDAPTAGADYATSLESLGRSALNRPDFIVLDIDPYIYSGAESVGAQPEFNVAAFEKARDVAFWLKSLLDGMHIESFVKTSGKTGLHVLVPVVRKLTFDTARAFADALGRHLMAEHPDVITMDQKVSKRTGKIFFDANMNARVKTLVAPYSARAVAGAPVAMPLTWKELERASPLDYTMANVPRLVAKRGDLWAGLLDAKQDLETVLGAR